MKTVEVVAHLGERDLRSAYESLGDIASYPKYSDAVRRVEVPRTGGDATVSEWKVNSCRGVMWWHEADTFDDRASRISVHQLEGDADSFEGSWSVERRPAGTTFESGEEGRAGAVS